jgi:hypothetical protein
VKMIQAAHGYPSANVNVLYIHAISPGWHLLGGAALLSNPHLLKEAGGGRIFLHLPKSMFGQNVVAKMQENIIAKMQDKRSDASCKKNFTPKCKYTPKNE